MRGVFSETFGRSLCIGFLCSSTLSCGAEPSQPNADPSGTASSSGGSVGVAVGGTAGVGGDGSLGSGGAAAGGSGNASGGGPSAVDFVENSANALAALTAYLMTAPDDRAPIEEQGFATVPLTAPDAETARSLLWEDHAATVRATRAGEMGATKEVAATVTVGEHSLRYYMSTRGTKPEAGWNLFLGMHGGGSTTAEANDGQWENQMPILEAYEPQNAILITPRAPTNTWDMWFTPQVDLLFARLIEDLIAFEGVNPNRVFLSGYSAGGDGTYQLGPRMADYWAGAAMSAGHPNDASPDSLRNVAFAIHVGGDDTAYDRNVIAAEWGGKLDALHALDPGGYFVQWQVHDGLPHWMSLAEKPSVPFMEMHTRDPLASRVVWRQASLTKTRSYWLAVPGEEAEGGDLVSAEYSEQTVTVTQAEGVSSLLIRLSDDMMALDDEVVVLQGEDELFRGTVTRTIGTLAQTLEERRDPELMFSSEVTVQVL